MPHLKAVYFLRPTAENVRLLQKEFKEPKYGEYHVFFSNLTRDGHIQALAESDEHEVVQQVRELRSSVLATGIVQSADTLLQLESDLQRSALLLEFDERFAQGDNHRITRT